MSPRPTYEEECIEALHEDVRQKLARLCLAGFRFNRPGPFNYVWVVKHDNYSGRYNSLMTAVEREWARYDFHEQ